MTQPQGFGRSDFDHSTLHVPSPSFALPRPEPEPDPHPGVGLTVGRYRIERRLGEGGMGVVLLAEDTQLARHVALKMPKCRPGDAEESLERFYREARSAATLNHPNICPVYDAGELDGKPFIAMGYVEGKPLSHFIASGKELPERWAAAVARKLALALDAAHQKGIIHRDVKPSNVMIDAGKEPILMDFGLARGFDGGGPKLTQEGMIIGSPAYMSPEQLGHGELGPATDIFSLGVLLYETLAGQLPFHGDSVALIGQIVAADPPALDRLRPDLSGELVEICSRAMAKSPGDRFASMRDFASALTAFLKRQTATELQSAPRTVPRKAPPRVPGADTEALAGPIREQKPGHRGTRRKKAASGNRSFLLAAGVTGGSLVAVGMAIAGLIFLAGDDATGVENPAEIRDHRPPAGFMRLEQKSFAEIDTDGNGFLNPHEFPLHIIRRADTDRDDTLTRAEFEAARVAMGDRLYAPPEGGPPRGRFPPRH